MLDSDLAKLYQVETKQLNRQVKRNIERFDSDFCFQLSKEEYQNLKCQIGTSNQESHGGRRKLPLVFAETGVSMLAGVLHSEIAIAISKEIIHALKLRLRSQLGTLKDTDTLALLTENKNPL